MTWEDVLKGQDEIDNFKRFTVFAMARVSEIMNARTDYLGPNLEVLLRNEATSKLIHKMTDEIESLSKTLSAFGEEILELQKVQDKFTTENA